MSRVGLGGRGESVWLGFFIDYILEQFLPVCRRFGDEGRFARYSEYRGRLRVALNDAGWDGQWYRRAYFDDGTPLGTAAADECRIDAIVQAWAVLSGAAPPDRAAAAVAEADRRLVDEKGGIIRLLDPPFDVMPQDPGYIKGYIPGVRENGGQYTHGVLWLCGPWRNWDRGRGPASAENVISRESWKHAGSRCDLSGRALRRRGRRLRQSAGMSGGQVGPGIRARRGGCSRVALESILGFISRRGRDCESILASPQPGPSAVSATACLMAEQCTTFTSKTRAGSSSA